jgi:hypothetical protein
MAFPPNIETTARLDRSHDRLLVARRSKSVGLN